ncbi:ABC transporter ATP-binding protein [Corynebacterium cystitidis]|uniref:ABC transporter ATP-binding protein n=1 Tax=Corynebacterium cystitidis TaxID=35757 RepID=UPI00211EA1CC|nr:ABC transporter ATP-binding protein [Corynebacterium cystitidis]
MTTKNASANSTSDGAEQESEQQQVSVSELIKPARPAMGVATILTGLGAVLKLAPFVALHQVAAIWLGGEVLWESVWGWVVVAIGGLFLGQLCYMLGLGVTHLAEVRLRDYLRRQVLSALARIPLGKVSQVPRGTIRKMVVDDTTSIHTLVAHGPGDATNAVVTVLAGCIYLLWVDWRFTLTLFAIVGVVLAVVITPSMRGYGSATEEYGRAQTNLAAASVEMLEGIQEIKNFQAAEATRTRYNAAREEFTEITYKWIERSGKAVWLGGAFLRPAIISVLVAILVAVFVPQGWMALEDTLPFFLLVPSIPEGVSTLLTLWQHLYNASMVSQTTGRLLAEEYMPEGIKSRKDVRDATVEMQHVTFGYEEGEPVLHDISFIATPGTVTAIVGPSGSGKSTIGLLAARFYDVDDGVITIGGVDVRELSFEALLSSVAIVLQDVALSNDSVHDNIVLGSPGATREQVIAAAKVTQIHERIMEMPDGYDTVLGSTGGYLSGGEKQRVALARTVLQDTPIIILDEATAQADPDSERAIHEAISQVVKDRTVIMIAHRLSTIQAADQILVIENGRIAECGQHKELLEAGGTYASMWHLPEG